MKDDVPMQQLVEKTFSNLRTRDSTSPDASVYNKAFMQTCSNDAANNYVVTTETHDGCREYVQYTKCDGGIEARKAFSADLWKVVERSGTVWVDDVAYKALQDLMRSVKRLPLNPHSGVPVRCEF